ncbi:hypothetical protein MCOR25_007617 [Pyricularia grisea]|uniref:Uncharacterized protein n=1 Tax=Pyricularia grisea TaxID=148305 RepID=A0A6P8B927_PYRGI|nr:uncharacterized protein PgNI_04768 [Pyricularia grisea]KAI6357573.1 hypothetical protein MCOR25_007617 [Pyricularia grisea]TLD12311.1 hypothetical protein PgNI_04768 [Pyricularia grisea]
MEDLDGASNLIADLLKKLSELDDKVDTYRKDMVVEFQRYSDDLLRDLPNDVTTQVNRAITASMSEGRYRNLFPQSLDEERHVSFEPESPAIDRKMWDGRGSPPPVLHHTSGVPNASNTANATIARALGSSPRDGVRDPHAREREFRGLFTPSYLPLLEAADRVSAAQPSTTTDSDSPPQTEEAKTSPKVAGGGSGVVPRFPPVRSFTDPSADCGSVESDKERNARRSALRRSSSSNRSSPRRVRFDFEGEVVLPTSSPSSSGVASSSPPPELAREEESHVPLNESPQATRPAAPSPPRSPSSRSLLDDEDDYFPPPKKVSSSQALRALSKLPLEDPSTWTVVNANSEPAAAEENKETAQPDAAPNFATYMPSSSHIEEVGAQPLGAAQLGSPLQDLEEYYDDSSESDDDFVSMPIRPIRKKSISPDARMPSLKPPETQPTQTRSPEAGVGEATKPNNQDDHMDSRRSMASKLNAKSSVQQASVATTTEALNADGELDGDELFDMEEDMYAKRDSQPYINHEDESDLEPETEAIEDAEREGIPMEKPPHSPSLFVAPKPQSISLTPPNVSAGSYKGRPVSFDVVKDHKLLHRAAELGDLHTFVGSIDGRSGVDGIDPSSYRGASFRGASSLSGLAFSGAPRSLSERMFLEDLAEEGGSLPKR